MLSRSTTRQTKHALVLAVYLLWLLGVSSENNKRFISFQPRLMHSLKTHRLWPTTVFHRKQETSLQSVNWLCLCFFNALWQLWLCTYFEWGFGWKLIREKDQWSLNMVLQEPLRPVVLILHIHTLLSDPADTDCSSLLASMCYMCLEWFLRTFDFISGQVQLLLDRK